jgi:hypothetical protein
LLPFLIRSFYGKEVFVITTSEARKRIDNVRLKDERAKDFVDRVTARLNGITWKEWAAEERLYRLNMMRNTPEGRAAVLLLNSLSEETRSAVLADLDRTEGLVESKDSQ